MMLTASIFNAVHFQQPPPPPPPISIIFKDPFLIARNVSKRMTLQVIKTNQLFVDGVELTKEDILVCWKTFWFVGIFMSYTFDSKTHVIFLFYFAVFFYFLFGLLLRLSKGRFTPHGVCLFGK